MIDIDVLRQRWSEIEHETAAQVPLNSFPAIEIQDVQLDAGHPLIGLDSDLNRHLLLPILPGTYVAADRKSSGLHLFGATWSENGKPIDVVDIVCLKPHLNDLFCEITYEILSALGTERERPDRAGRKVIARWREFLSQDAGNIPDDAAVVGLTGELLILTKLAQRSSDALRSWTGPEGGKHDFVGSHCSIEVKSTLRRQGIIIAVNGAEQLLSMTGKNLFLSVLQFEQVTSGGVNIAGLIDGLVELGVDRMEILRKTSLVGFGPDVIASLRDKQFNLLAAKHYVVDASFPRITPESFVGGQVPARITALAYSIDLSTPPPTPLSEGQVISFLDGFFGA